MPWVVRISRPPAGVGDSEQTVEMVGPFDDLGVAAAALRAAGWTTFDWEREPTEWETAADHSLRASVFDLADEPQRR